MFPSLALLSAVTTLLVPVLVVPAEAVAAAPPATADPERVTVTFPAVADSTVVRQRPDARRGARPRLSFGAGRRWEAWSLVRFQTRNLPDDGVIVSAAVSGQSLRRLPDGVRLQTIRGSWTEGRVSWADAPDRGRVVATAQVGGTGRRALGFDVTELVSGNQALSLAISSTAATASAIRSRETGRGPVLAVTYEVAADDGGGGGGGGGTTPDPAPPAAETLYGASFALNGRRYRDALADTDALFGGRLDVVRVFYPGPPKAWPGKAPGRDQVVSFKYPPAAINAGSHDQALRAWFRSAPRDNRIWWSYYHEPEDNIERGQFTAEEYRAAWQRISDIAAEVDNPQLRSALVLMSWTTDARSRRDWRDYYTPDVDVFAWDVYSHVAYPSPADFLGVQREISASTGKSFGIAEVGVELAPGDPTGVGRGRFPTALGAWLEREGAEFATYFHHTWNDSTDDGADHYELDDQSSIDAWTALIQG